MDTADGDEKLDRMVLISYLPLFQNEIFCFHLRHTIFEAQGPIGVEVDAIPPLI
jgi:hypothetical protein